MFRKLLRTLIWVLPLFSTAALADGFIIPIPPPGIPRVPPLSIKYHHVDVIIQDQVAVTKVDQVFINHYERDLEGTYIFPIPEEASISKFSMYVEGERLQGRLLGRDEARRLYEEIVRRQQDPAILEYIGRDMFKARVYPIPGHGEKRIGLDYSEVLKMDNGLCVYTYSLDTEKFSRDPIQDVAIDIELRSKFPIKTIYSPTHDISVNKVSDHHARITYAEKHSKPDQDLMLYYTVSEEELGLNLLAYQNEERAGFFLALISPRVDLGDLQVAKDLFFLLDTSGSMQGEKIQQAKDALTFCLRGLNPEDRFNLVAFSTNLKTLSAEPLTAHPDEIERGLDFLDGLSADGGTNIHDALQEALRQIKASPRPSMVVFLTDGLPTVGQTDTERILERIKRLNQGEARIFVFGVGYDVNTHFLDRLASENGAVSEYVRPEESIEVKVSRFYGKISTPVLTDLSLELGRMGASEIYPRELPDLFKGSQIIVLGRYRDGGPTILTLRGRAGEAEKSYTYETDVSAKQQYAFIPQLWASRKIGYLLDQIRLNGHSQELVDEIVSLSKEYGAMTEYTSFLVDLDVMVSKREMAEEAGRLMADAFEKKSGAIAVDQSINLGVLKSSSAAPANVFRDERGHTRQIAGVKRIIDKTFYLKQGVWTDNDYQIDQRIVRVKRFSDAYFQLVARLSAMGRYLSLGDQVLVSLPGGAVQIGDEGLERLSEKELEQLM